MFLFNIIELLLLSILTLFILLYIQYSFISTENKTDSFKTIFTKIVDILDEMEIPFFLSSGTCLGYMREGNIIGHDKDIDIGIFIEDYTPTIIDVFNKNGIYLTDIIGNPNTGYKYVFKTNTSLTVDIVLYYKSDDLYTTYNKYCSPFELEKVIYFDKQVSVPTPTNKYLQEIYGPNWRIPQ
jgi:fukutin